MAIETGITIEEFELLPDSLCHNHLRHVLLRLLGRHVDENKLGAIIFGQEFNFGGVAHSPDVSFIGARKLHLRDGKRRVQPFVPDLAIEIVSDNDGFESLME